MSVGKFKILACLPESISHQQAKRKNRNRKSNGKTNSHKAKNHYLPATTRHYLHFSPFQRKLWERDTLPFTLWCSPVPEGLAQGETKHYVKLRIDNAIPVKAIVATGVKTKQYIQLDQSEFRESKVIPSSQFPFEQEINIYGNKIAIINHRKGSKLLGIIIDNTIIAATFKSWFKLTWEKLN